MPSEPKTLLSVEDAYMRRLIDATGVTAAQARDLLNLFGCDMPSLVREARLLKQPGG